MSQFIKINEFYDTLQILKQEFSDKYKRNLSTIDELEKLINEKRVKPVWRTLKSLAGLNVDYHGSRVK
jgi:hypothetical protein